MSESALPLISVIVAVKNGQKTLVPCLESLAAQTYKPVEIIVINDGSTDRTGDILAEFAMSRENVFIISTAGLGPSGARNLGIARAKGAYIAFTDGDCICDSEWLKILAACIVSGPRVAGVGGDQQSPDDDTAYGKFIKTIGFVADYVKSAKAADCVPTMHNPTCNVLYRKAIFDEIGMFTTGLWPGEDVDLDYRVTRAGYELRYAKLAVVKHYRPGSVRIFARMMYRYGHAQARLVRMHGMFRLIHFVPVALALALLACLLMLFLGQLAELLALCFTPVIFAIIYFMLKTKDIGISARYAFHLLVTVLYWHAGFLAGLFFRQKQYPDRIPS